MTRMPSARSIAVAVLLAFAPVAVLSGQPAHAQQSDGTGARNPEGPTSALSIVTKTGVYPFKVEVADTPDERALGLMFRRKMAADHGMLFDMGHVGEADFWMENTFIPLDIVFIGADGKVVSVAEHTTPMSRALIPSDGAVRYVLELNAYTARRIGLARGDEVRHARIGR